MDVPTSTVESSVERIIQENPNIWTIIAQELSLLPNVLHTIIYKYLKHSAIRIFSPNDIMEINVTEEHKLQVREFKIQGVFRSLTTRVNNDYIYTLEQNWLISYHIPTMTRYPILEMYENIYDPVVSNNQVVAFPLFTHHMFAEFQLLDTVNKKLIPIHESFHKYDYNTQRVFIDSNIYKLTGTVLERFNLESKTWTKLSPKPSNYTQSTLIAMTADIIWVIGGILPRDQIIDEDLDDYEREADDDDMRSDHVLRQRERYGTDHIWQYTISTNSWYQQDLTLPLALMSCCGVYDSLNHVLVISGGRKVVANYEDARNLNIYAISNPLTCLISSAKTLDTSSTMQSTYSSTDFSNNLWIIYPSQLNERYCLGFF